MHMYAQFVIWYIIKRQAYLYNVRSFIHTIDMKQQNNAHNSDKKISYAIYLKQNT